MAWNFLMKNRADTKINKNNTINVINNNTQALIELTKMIEKINNTLNEHNIRITKLENK